MKWGIIVDMVREKRYQATRPKGENTVAEIINIEEKRVPTGNPVAMNEDFYRDQILNAISALQEGETKKAESTLYQLLEDVGKGSCRR
jgi:hypothetical protein